MQQISRKLQFKKLVVTALLVPSNSDKDSLVQARTIKQGMFCELFFLFHSIFSFPLTFCLVFFISSLCFAYFSVIFFFLSVSLFSALDHLLYW